MPPQCPCCGSTKSRIDPSLVCLECGHRYRPGEPRNGCQPCATCLHDRFPDREHLLKALKQVGWSQRRAAALLGMPRSTLREQLVKFRITHESWPSKPKT